MDDFETILDEQVSDMDESQDIVHSVVVAVVADQQKQFGWGEVAVVFHSGTG